jgi:hypothetical protein
LSAQFGERKISRQLGEAKVLVETTSWDLPRPNQSREVENKPNNKTPQELVDDVGRGKESWRYKRSSANVGRPAISGSSLKISVWSLALLAIRFNLRSLVFTIRIS